VQHIALQIAATENT